MARRYDRLIRYNDSWFDDLLDPDKELKPGECWQVILAIRECERQEDTEPLTKLPLAIRRALSMSTLREQLEIIIARIQSARNKGANGGNEKQRRVTEGVVKPQDPKIKAWVESQLLTPENERDVRVVQLQACGIDDIKSLTAIILALRTHGLQGLRTEWVTKARKCNDPTAYLLTCINNE